MDLPSADMLVKTCTYYLNLTMHVTNIIIIIIVHAIIMKNMSSNKKHS